MSRWKRITLSQRWLILPPILIGIVVLALLAASRKELPRVEAVESATPLKVTRVSREWVRPQVTGYGTAVAHRSWNAISEVGGRIVRTHPNLRSGAPVQSGELLIEIDLSDYELRLRQRKADLQQAESQLSQLKLDQIADTKSLEIQRDLLAVKQADVERLETLRKRSAASAAEFDAARSGVLQQELSVQTLKGSISTYPARIESAEASIETAAARVSEAERDLQRTRIDAPFHGLLQNVRLEPGQYVAPGQALFELIDTSSVEIETQISLSQWRRLVTNIAPDLASDSNLPVPRDADGDEGSGPSMADQFMLRETPSSVLTSLSATVVSRNLSDKLSFVGNPVRFSSSIDTRTRTLGIILRVQNPVLDSGAVDPSAIQLRAGSYCEVILQTDQPIHAFRIPRAAVDDSTVLVIDEESRLRRKEIDISFFLDRDAIVRGGLNDGDLVVTTPPAVALEGQLAEPIDD